MHGHISSTADDALRKRVLEKMLDDVGTVIRIGIPQLFWEDIAIEPGEESAVGTVRVDAFSESPADRILRNVNVRTVEERRNDNAMALANREIPGKLGGKLLPRADEIDNSIRVGTQSAVENEIHRAIQRDSRWMGPRTTCSNAANCTGLGCDVANNSAHQLAIMGWV